jgi:hypothetical protein
MSFEMKILQENFECVGSCNKFAPLMLHRFKDPCHLQCYAMLIGKQLQTATIFKVHQCCTVQMKAMY